MCFELNAEPPIESTGGGSVQGQDLILQSADGTQFATYAAQPQNPTGAGIVILPDVRGLFHFYKELALRFAEAGVTAISIDYFGRTSDIATRGEDFDFMSHVMQTKFETLSADVATAVAYLRGLPNPPKTIFTVGFCFGGSISFNQAGSDQNLAGVIGFYGNPVASRLGAPTPVERVSHVSCPVLGFFGGADQGIPAESISTFDKALSQKGLEHELITYPGAPHSFFDRNQEKYANESADAWKRSLEFIKAHS
jgi:carboxymethylenebutenolidase